LIISPDSRYTLVAANDGLMIAETTYLQGKQRGRRRKAEPSSGQIMLYDEVSGQIGTMWYEFNAEGVMEITEMDSTKYEARRAR
jgi:hypothetical protein